MSKKSAFFLCDSAKNNYLCRQITSTMKKIRTLVTALLLTATAVCHADGFEYLVVEQTNGTTAETALASFDQIRFTDGKMVILNGGTAMASYPLVGLKKMYFGNGATAITQVEAARPVGEVEVYTTSGVLVKRGDASLAGLPGGIYIIKDGRGVRKVTR